MTVGRRAAHRLCSEIATGSATIFHHHSVSEALAELLTRKARDNIGDAAGGECNLKCDGLGRISLPRRRLCTNSDDLPRQDPEHGTVSSHPVPLHPAFAPAA